MKVPGCQGLGFPKTRELRKQPLLNKGVICLPYLDPSYTGSSSCGTVMLQCCSLLSLFNSSITVSVKLCAFIVCFLVALLCCFLYSLVYVPEISSAGTYSDFWWQDCGDNFESEILYLSVWHCLQAKCERRQYVIDGNSLFYINMGFPSHSFKMHPIFLCL